MAFSFVQRCKYAISTGYFHLIRICLIVLQIPYKYVAIQKLKVWSFRLRNSNLCRLNIDRAKALQSTFFYTPDIYCHVLGLVFQLFLLHAALITAERFFSPFKKVERFQDHKLFKFLFPTFKISSSAAVRRNSLKFTKPFVIHLTLNFYHCLKAFFHPRKNHIIIHRSCFARVIPVCGLGTAMALAK